MRRGEFRASSAVCQELRYLQTCFPSIKAFCANEAAPSAVVEFFFNHQQQGCPGAFYSCSAGVAESLSQCDCAQLSDRCAEMHGQRCGSTRVAQLLQMVERWFPRQTVPKRGLVSFITVSDGRKIALQGLPCSFCLATRRRPKTGAPFWIAWKGG